MFIPATMIAVIVECELDSCGYTVQTMREPSAHSPSSPLVTTVRNARVADLDGVAEQFVR